MYGMVNQAIKSMVTEQLGAAAWEEVCKKTNLDPSGFESFKQYDDTVTTDLVGAVCEKTQMPPEKILEAFGEYWISYARKSEYRLILEAFAGSPIELIESLDHLHSRLQASFDNLKAPSFWVTKVNETEVIVHYKSQRQLPLQFFVVGLLKGIFKMYNKECQVEQVPALNNETAVFKVTF